MEQSNAPPPEAVRGGVSRTLFAVAVLIVAVIAILAGVGIGYVLYTPPPRARLTVGTNAPFAPFESFNDTTGRFEGFDIIGDHRGLGLMRMTEFVSDPTSKKPDPKVRNTIMKDMYEHGVIALPCGESGIRYIPALNIPEDLMETGLDIVEESIARAAR